MCGGSTDDPCPCCATAAIEKEPVGIKRKLVNWTCTWMVEDLLRFPTPSTPITTGTDGGILDISGNSPFSMDKIGDKDFALKTTKFFFQSVKEFLSLTPGSIMPGIESATIEILHEKGDPDVYHRFQTNEASHSSGWGELNSLNLEVSFKSKAKGETEGVWKVISAFEIPLTKRNKGTGQETGFYFMAKLCNIDVFKGYAISYPPIQNDNHFRLELPIQVSVRVSKNSSGVPGDSSHRIVNTSPTNSMDFMKKLLSDGLHSDITIHVGEMTFACHKSILAGQSDVFAAMFDSKMSEANSKVIEITDMSVAGAEAMLKYLYYKDVEESVSNCGTALELLKAGHKYQIKDLELESRSILSSMAVDKFDASTAFELFEFCGMVEGFQNGQTKPAQIFKENSATYFETEEFQAVMLVKPKIVANLFKAVALL